MTMLKMPQTEANGKNSLKDLRNCDRDKVGQLEKRKTMHMATSRRGSKYKNRTGIRNTTHDRCWHSLAPHLNLVPVLIS